MKRSFAILLAAALLLCLLPGMALEAKAETIRNTCPFCYKMVDLEITGFDRFNDDYHYIIYKCPLCGKGTHALFVGNLIGYHSGGAETPTCTTGKTCAKCGTQYGKLGHDWGAWQSRGNNSAHFRTCQRDGCDAVDTASCSGDSRATCIELGICTTCGGRYYGAHTFLAPPNWDSDAENHWLSCTVCRKAKTQVGAHFFVQGTLSSCLKSAATCVSPPVYYTNCAYCYHKGTDTYLSTWERPDPNNHDLVHHDAKAPTCTEIGWKEYDACQREGCTYTTKVELPALKHRLVHHDAKAPTCTEIGWEEYDTCSRCDYTTKVELPALKHNLVHHDAKAPTCTETGWAEYDTCFRCDYTTYQEIPALKHNLVRHNAKAPTCTETGWEEYDTCFRCDYTTYQEIPALKHNLVHHDAKAPTCTEIGWEEYDTCSRCDYTTKVELPALKHNLVHHDAKAPTCTEIGWEEYDTCSRCDYTTYQEIPALKHNLVHHDAKAPTCTEIGWEEYDTCSRCDFTTYHEIPALKHNLVHHDAKAPTCTEIGWEEYDTCSRCDYTTKVELPALKHNLVHHDAKAPTCTEIGWEEYDTCSRCDYTTYQEIPAPGHDYAEEVVKPTCEKDGYTLHTCKKCNDSYKDHWTQKRMHWYGEWTNNGDGAHSAACKREGCNHVGKTACAIVEFRQEEAALTLCPICGNVSDGTHLALVKKVTAEGKHLPQGEPVLRMGEIAKGNTLLSVCFEYSGRLTQPKGQVKITLPAELLDGVTLALLNADGTEANLPYTVEGENAVFTLDFSDAEIPTVLIRRIPTAE